MLNINNNIYSNNQYSYKNTKARPAFTGLPKISGKNTDVFVSSKIKEYSPNNIFKRLISELLPIEEMKQKPPVIADDLHSMITELVKKSSDAIGKDAIVYSIPNHKNLVLRVEKSALSSIDSLGKDLVPIPVKY